MDTSHGQWSLTEDISEAIVQRFLSSEILLFVRFGDCWYNGYATCTFHKLIFSIVLEKNKNKFQL
jgi:hypothetical protein